MKVYLVTITPKGKRPPYDCEVLAATRSEALEFVRKEITEDAWLSARVLNEKTIKKYKTDWPTPIEWRKR